MSIRSSVLVGVVALGIGLAAGRALSQDAGGDAPPPRDPMAEMEAYTAANAMNENHERMARIVGEWDVAGKTWMGPDAPAMESVGKAKFTPLLGGRFIQQEYSTAFMGMPYTGLGISGYDNAKKAHFDCWFDSMSTGKFISEGNWSEDGKTYTAHAEHTNVVSGETEKMKSVVVHESADKFVFTMYSEMPDGTSVKGMELTYTRKKQ